VTRKIIFVAVVRLTDKVARDWYVDDLIERGATVEYWDIVSLVREEHSEQGEKRPAYLQVLRDFGEVEARLRLPENRDALYVMLISYAGQFTRVFRLLSRYGCRMLFIAWGAMPRDPVFKGRKIAAALARPWWAAKEIFYRSKATALRRLRLVRPFDIVFAAGEVLTGSAHYATKIVPINLCDYDHYMQVRTGAQRLVSERYAVFLDINLPHQSDLAFCGYPQIDSGRYYRSLNRFFGLLEQEYGIKIIIAAHPKAAYDAATFEGRRFQRLVTAELVRDAEFVLSHTSTSLSYAVLNAKPLIFIYTDDMAAAYRVSLLRELRCYAEFLGAPLLNIDTVTQGREVAVGRVDAEKYSRYKYGFLTTRESEGTPTQEIIWRALATY
jgi:hypothetical protein